MPDLRENEPYTPCWAIVPGDTTAANPGHSAVSHPAEAKSPRQIEFVLAFWVAVALAAAGLYAAVHDLL